MTEIAPVRTVARAFTRDGRFPTVQKMFFRSSLTHRKILTILLSLVWLPATTQALDIAEGWRFTKGDDPVVSPAGERASSGERGRLLQTLPETDVVARGGGRCIGLPKEDSF